MRPTTLAATLALTLVTSAARADLWCARHLAVHEWGVHVFGRDGRPLAPSGGTPGELPTWFITPTTRVDVARRPVRTLPADTGVRKLPVVHVFAPASAETSIPLGLEVGFSHGTASWWYPDVDRLAATTSPRELVWDRLELTPAPTRPPRGDEGLDWIARSRALDGALWVNGAGASERFIFYEADTREVMPLVVARGLAWSPTRHHYTLTNRGRHPVHDVFLVHRDGALRHLVYVSTLAAGQTHEFVLEAHALDDRAWRGATHDRLRGLLALTSAEPAAPKAGDDCVMGRDPAVPFEQALDHHLNPEVVALILSVWGARFFESEGTRLVYREDSGYLAEAMPLSIYTDMFHTITLRRAGLALQEDVVLP